MGLDLPPVTSADISSEFQKPQAGEVVSVGVCKSPDFQTQFDELQSQTKEKTAKLQEEIQYSEKQKEVLRNIYCSLGEDNPELKSAIETQSVKIFEVPNRDLVALSVDGKNVDFIYGIDGKEISKEDLYDKEISKLGETFSLSNLDWILKSDTRKGFLESSLKDLNGVFDKNNNIILDGRVVVKGTEEYNLIINGTLKDFIFVIRALLIDAKQRNSDLIYELY